MNLDTIVKELEQERSRIDRALQALKDLLGTAGSGKASGQPRQQKKTHTMSAAARRKISLAQKARWAKVKKH
jgi:hypothetical protein